MEDNNLIKKYLLWDENALEILLEKHLQSIFSACYRVCLDEIKAQDITQNVVLKIIKWLPQFSFKSEFKTWYFRIAYNESITFLNKNKILEDLWDYEESLSFENNFWKGIDDKEVAKKVTIEINKLPTIERNIILYYYYDELKIKEISEIMWINENTIKTKLSRTKNLLKTNFEKYEDFN